MAPHHRTGIVLLLALAVGLAGFGVAGAAPTRLAFQAPGRLAKAPQRHEVTRRLLTDVQVNGGFETTLAPWSAWNGTLARVSGGAVGSWAAKLTSARGASSYALSTSPAQVASTVAGTTYTGTAYVRTDAPGQSLCIRIREWNGSTVAGSGRSCVTGTTAWRPVPAVAYKALASGRKLDLYAYSENGGAGLSFVVDAVGLDVASAAPPTTSSPTTTTTTTTSPVPTTTTAPAANPCDRVASPAGSDSAAGTAGAPYATAQKLVNSLSAGQTGCLRAGTYGEDVSFRTGGSPGNPITLTSYPGERATVVGRMVVFDSANDVTVTRLNLNGKRSSPMPSPTIDGDRVTFSDDDVTNDHTMICFDLGSVDGWGTAVDVTITRNRIHDCGRLPATNHDHGIYVEKTRNAVITDNVIYGNADRGVQLYPDAQNTLIANNVIDGNGIGVIFSGELGFASSGNVVRDNVITNSRLTNLESWWAAGNPVGTGNSASHNCLWNGGTGNVGETSGYVVSGSIVADPQFVDRSGADFRLKAGSPCAGMGPR